MMPEVTGIELAEYVLTHHPACKIQLMSGYSENIDTSAIPQLLYSNRISKPFEILELSKRLANLGLS